MIYTYYITSVWPEIRMAVQISDLQNTVVVICICVQPCSDTAYDQAINLNYS